MAWDERYALEGMFVFGGPLNVHQYVIDTGKFGQSTETYHVAHFQLDNDKELENCIMAKIRGEGPAIKYYPRFLLMERVRDSFNYKMVNTFYQPWLFSLTRDEFGGISSPFDKWAGLTLGIACYKKFNPHIHTTDW